MAIRVPVGRSWAKSTNWRYDHPLTAEAIAKHYQLGQGKPASKE
jgi:hypothetical protein